MVWAAYPCAAAPAEPGDNGDAFGSYIPPFAVQHVRRVNYGPLEANRYFVPVEGKTNEFVEVTEEALLQANFQKLNSYKNYKCETHNNFFELNIYQKNPVNEHHWRTNLARPASEIDL